MIEIKDLLARFDKILNKEDFKISLVQDVLKNNIGLIIPRDKIKIKGGDVFLDIKNIYKNEILLKQDKIKKELEDNNSFFKNKNIF